MRNFVTPKDAEFCEITYTIWNLNNPREFRISWTPTTPYLWLLKNSNTAWGSLHLARLVDERCVRVCCRFVDSLCRLVALAHYCGESGLHCQFAAVLYWLQNIERNDHLYIWQTLHHKRTCVSFEVVWSFNPSQVVGEWSLFQVQLFCSNCRGDLRVFSLNC